MYDDGTQTAVNAIGGCVEIRKQTLTERLKQEREQLSARLAELDAAIGALEANPQVQAVLDLVQKVARY